MSAAPGGYVALLRLPGAAALLALVSVARLVYGALPLALLLLVSSARSSYAEAGLVTGLYALAAGVLGPARARLVDRFGADRALPALAAALAACLGLLVAAVHGPLPVLAVLGLLAGSLPPPVGPVMRTAWRQLADRPDEQEKDALRRAYALDAVTEEGAFVIGPVLGAAAVSRAGPSAVVVACLVVLAVTATAVGVSAAPLLAVPRAGAGRPPQAPLWRRRRFLAALLPACVVGALLGVVELAAVAIALGRAGTWATGVPGAALATGSLVGGAVYGRRAWPGSAGAHAAVLALVVAAGVAVASGLAGLFTPFVVAAAALGLAVAPAIVATYLSVDEAAPEGGSEPTAWVNATFNTASAGGTAAAGVAIDAWSPGAALACAAATAGLVLLAGRLAVRRGQPEKRYSTSGSHGPPR